MPSTDGTALSFMFLTVSRRIFIYPEARSYYSVQSVFEIIRLIACSQGYDYRFIFMPGHSKNGEGASSVTPVRPSVRPFVRPSVRTCVRRQLPFNRFKSIA